MGRWGEVCERWRGLAVRNSRKKSGDSNCGRDLSARLNLNKGRSLVKYR